MENNYILKHKDNPVIEFTLDEDYKLIDIGRPIDEERLPFGLKYKGNEKAYFRQMADWIEKRGLPEGRSDLANIKVNNHLQRRWLEYWGCPERAYQIFCVNGKYY